MVGLYMDVHIHGAVTRGLRARNVDVITAQEDGCGRLLDPPLLDRATALGRVLFTEDDDFLAEASRRQAEYEYFTGVIYIHQHRLRIGRCIEELEVYAKAAELQDFENRVLFLTL